MKDEPPMKDEREFRAALAAFVREHMPWPFADISPFDSEGTDAAWEIAKRLEGEFLREFANIATTARNVKRQSYEAKKS